jgi:hypothetical protein
MAVAQQTNEHAVNEALLTNDAGGDVIADVGEIGGGHELRLPGSIRRSRPRVADGMALAWH